MRTADIILDQIKTIDSRALWAWGAKKLVAGEPTKDHDGFLQFTVVNCPNVPQNTTVRITLGYDDVYTVKIFKSRKIRGKMEVKETVFCEAEGVYVDMLIETIDRIVG